MLLMTMQGSILQVCCSKIEFHDESFTSQFMPTYLHAQLQAWVHLQMTVKLAKQLKAWHLQSLAFQGNYAAFSNHSRLVWNTMEWNTATSPVSINCI